MKKYIITVSAALALGMAFSACAKEEEVIVPIIMEGSENQQTVSTPEVTPDAAPDAAAQISKTQTVEGTGYTAVLTQEADGNGGLVYRLKASAGGNEKELMEYTAGAGDGISAEVYEIDDLFGFPAFCFELSYVHIIYPQTAVSSRRVRASALNPPQTATTGTTLTATE